MSIEGAKRLPGNSFYRHVSVYIKEFSKISRKIGLYQENPPTYQENSRYIKKSSNISRNSDLNAQVGPREHPRNLYKKPRPSTLSPGRGSHKKSYNLNFLINSLKFSLIASNSSAEYAILLIAFTCSSVEAAISSVPAADCSAMAEML